MSRGNIIGRCWLCDNAIWEDESYAKFNDLGSGVMIHALCFYDFTDKIKRFIELVEDTVDFIGGKNND